MEEHIIIAVFCWETSWEELVTFCKVQIRETQMASVLKSTIVYNVMLYSQVEIYQSFRGTYFLLIQDRRASTADK
jgi:hypothetical protein